MLKYFIKIAGDITVFIFQNGENSTVSYSDMFSIRKLQKKFLSVSFKNEREFVENHAFEGIGDDDL